MIHDLTFAVSPSMQTFDSDWHCKVSFEATGNISVEGRRASKVGIGTHSGTHVDAPSHFIRDGQAIHQFPLDLMVGRATVLDFRDAPNRHRIELPEFLGALAQRQLSERVLLLTGWSRNYGTASFYSDSPYIDTAVARFFVESGVRLLGHDMPSLDNPSDDVSSAEDSPIHKLLLGSGIWLVEYINSQSIPMATQELDIIVAPLPLIGLDGSPARCLGIDSH